MQTLQHQQKNECAKQANTQNQQQQKQNRHHVHQADHQKTHVHMLKKMTVTHEFAN